MTSFPDALACCARGDALKQRATLLEAVWADTCRNSGSIVRAMLPVSLMIVLPVPGYVQEVAPLDDYAVDLGLAPDAVWRVLRDRVGAHPGAALLGAPLLAVFLPVLCRSLLGQRLLLPSWPVLWFGDAGTGARVAAAPARHGIGDAFDPAAPTIELAGMTPDRRALLQRRMLEAPEGMVARLDPSSRDIVRVVWRLPNHPAAAVPCGRSQNDVTEGVFKDLLAVHPV